MSEKIHIKEILNLDVSSTEIENAHRLFFDYFYEKYKRIPSEKLGIHDVAAYLDSIFEKTLHSLTHEKLTACLAYKQEEIIGFSTFGPLEQERCILLRTIPVHLKYESIKRDIRLAFLRQIKIKYAQARKVIMMVRPANTSYAKFCSEVGFKKENGLFKQSTYLIKTYDSKAYDVYTKNI